MTMRAVLPVVLLAACASLSPARRPAAGGFSAFADDYFAAQFAFSPSRGTRAAATSPWPAL
jgi:hypothetical protein